MPLTDEQIVACLSHEGDRTAMLNAAYRMGMQRAAEMQTPVLWENNHETDDFERGVTAMYDAIRAEAGE